MSARRGLAPLVLLVACVEKPTLKPDGAALDEPGATSSTSAADETTAAPPADDASPAPCPPPCAAPWELDGDISHTMYVPEDQDHDLSAYECLTVLHGDLVLSDPVPPEQLVHLRHLQRVDGHFELDSIPGLTDLSAFACLSSVGSLYLRDTGERTLVDTALPSLRWAPLVQLSGVPLPTFAPEFAGLRSLQLQGVVGEDLDAAATWQSLGDLELEITHAYELKSVAGLAQLVAGAPRRVHLGILPELRSLHGLETMTAPDSLSLFFMPELTSLSGLSGITSIGTLTLHYVDRLGTFAGLHNLVTADWFVLQGCSSPSQLASLAGLDSLAAVDTLELEFPSLRSLAGAPQLTSVREFGVHMNPDLDPAAVDAFLAQLDQPPESVMLWPGCGPDH